MPEATVKIKSLTAQFFNCVNISDLPPPTYDKIWRIGVRSLTSEAISGHLKTFHQLSGVDPYIGLVFVNSELFTDFAADIIMTP